MIKISRMVTLLVVFFVGVLSFGTISKAQYDEKKVIMRTIVTEIKWNENLKQIDIDRKIISKVGDEPIEVFDDTYVIETEFSGENISSDSEAIEFVYEKATLVFHVDKMFGKKVSVFRDLAKKQDKSQADIDTAIEEAKIQIEKDYLNPPLVQERVAKKTTSLANSSVVILLLIVSISLMIILYIRRRRSKTK